MKIWVARKAPRKALFLPMGQVEKNPSLLFPMLNKIDPSELDELVRAELEKQGISNESDVHKIVGKAEEEYEQRIKTAEASREVRRLLKIKAEGGKLMQVGNKKWRQAFYPAVRRDK
jgi:hypothetical protein